MDRYSVIVMSAETAPVRRFEFRKVLVRRLVWCAGFTALLLTVLLGDYVRVRIDNAELDRLRTEVAEQRDQIESFESTLNGVRAKLASIGEFERKVRIIANLPGSAATGGEDVAELGADAPEPDAALDDAEAPAPFGASLPESESQQQSRFEADSDAPLIVALQRGAAQLGELASSRELSLADVADQLESKRSHLAATPAIWPTKGWLTSRFGMRISPFTNQRQFHAGIDVAGERGTDIVAPANGKVVFAGSRGPLGKSITIDHGYGLRTQYGHSEALYVKVGDAVERGQRIASLGNTGRSTGPHLHYTVEVNGKAVNPLDYIFD